jgi:hypothetical protein
MGMDRIPVPDSVQRRIPVTGSIDK